MQLQKEAREKEEPLQRMLSAEKRVRTLEVDNRQLRREHADMRKELDKLRKEVCQPQYMISLCSVTVANCMMSAEVQVHLAWLVCLQNLSQSRRFSQC